MGEEKTKETEAQEIEAKINEIKDSLKNEKSAIHDLYSRSSPKKDLILLWAEYLEHLAKLGKYQKPISTISSHITQELTDMKIKSAISYVRKVLPFKYKNFDNKASENNAVTNENDSRKTSSDVKQHRKANKDYVKLLRASGEFLLDFADSIRDIELIEKLDPTEYQLLMKRHEHFLQLCKEATDKRTNVLPKTQFMFIEAFSIAGLNHCFSIYVKYLKEFTELTGKQSLKILSGKIQNIIPLYDPKTRIEALQSGFYGVRCEKCGSWRIDLVYHSGIGERLHCYNCTHEFLPIAETLPHKALKKKDN